MSFLSSTQAFSRAAGFRSVSRPASTSRSFSRRMSSSPRFSGDRVRPLVNAKWLSEELKSRSNVVVLDTSWYMASERRNVAAEFEKTRIPGARLFSIDEVCDKSSKLPHMLPSTEDFCQAVSALGISNNTHVVCYDTNPHFMASARVWWTFRYFGHDQISLLDGGLNSWVASGLPLENTAPTQIITPSEFKVSNPRKHLLKTLKQIQSNLKKDEFTLLDARMPARFHGTEPEPREGLQSGHIPGSINLPFKRVLDGLGSFKNEAQLRDLLAELELDPSLPMATTCGSGVTASIVAFALYLLGKNDVAVYDGSWSEYGQTSLNLPIEKK